MSLTQLFNILNGITGFSGKVAYLSFPENQAPALPFICYMVKNSNNFVADGVVYHTINNVDVELYTETKDTTTEAAVETALSAAGIPWQKEEDYIDSERMFMITYSFDI